MKFRSLAAVVAGVVAAAVGAANLAAHPVTIMGSVSAVAPNRVEVQPVDPATGKPTAEKPAWYDVTEKTKITRGDKTVTFAEAKIEVGERIAVLGNHGADGKVTTTAVKLAAK